MANRYWFKPRSFGYGPTPASWEGWAVTVGFVALLFVSVRVVHWLIADSDTAGTVAKGLAGALAVGYLWLCTVKGDRVWHLHD